MNKRLQAAGLLRLGVSANAQRAQRGTDWLHFSQVPGGKLIEISPRFQIDDGRLMNQWTV